MFIRKFEKKTKGESLNPRVEAPARIKWNKFGKRGFLVLTKPLLSSLTRACGAFLYHLELI